MLLDLAISAPSLFLLISMLTLHLPRPVRALSLPTIHQTVLTEILPLREGLSNADTVNRTSHRRFLAAHPLINDGGSVCGGGHVFLYLLVLPEGVGNKGPLLWGEFELCLFAKKAVEVILFDFCEFFEEVPLSKKGNYFLIDI
jgi:hypothetical protein